MATNQHPQPAGSIAQPGAAGTDDTRLDSRSASDADYLAKLGYKQELNRALGLFSSFGIQFSSIAVGSSMFTTLIVGLAFFGPASFWSFAGGGFLQVFVVGLAIAELVSAYPLAGGVYQINNRITKRPWIGWQSGWWLVIAHTVSLPAIAVAITPFVANWFGVSVTTTTQTIPWAIGLIALITIINLFGVRIATYVNNIGVAAELCGILIVTIALLVVHHSTQPVSFLSNTGGTVVHGAWLKPALFALILPTYIISSFDSSGNAAEETHNASRKAPMGLFIANSAAWIFGTLLMALLLLAIKNLPAVMASPLPTKMILEGAVGNTVTTIFQALAVSALIACMCVLQLTGVRVLWSQARDGQMPLAHWLHRVDRRHVPVTATLVVFVMAVIFTLWSSALTVLSALTALAWALAYGVVVCSGFYAAVKHKLPAHPFSLGRFAPWVLGVAIVWSVILCIALVWSNPKQVGLGMLGAIAAGVVLYLLVPASRRGKVAGVSVHPVVETDAEPVAETS
jgi:amino acid transporter